MECNLLNKLRRKHSLIMKFDQVMSSLQKKKLVPDPFVFAKNQAQPLLENEIFEVSYLNKICNSKTCNSKICPSQHADLLRFLLTEDSLKIKNVLELLSRPHFSQNFLTKIFILQYFINWPNFITRVCKLSNLFSKICFVFHTQAFDDVMTFEYLKS